MQRSVVSALLVVWIACVSSDFAVARGGVSPEAGAGAEQEVVSAWSEQVLQWDELTRCIRGSETGNAIERWLDCLESLEDASSDLTPPAQAQQPGVVTEGAMSAFDPLSEASKRFDGDFAAVQGLGFGGEEAMEVERPAQEVKSAAASAVVSEDPVTDVGEVQVAAQSSSETEMSERMEVPEKTEISPSLEDIRLNGKGIATDVRGLTSKWGTDVSKDSLPSSDVGCLEVVPKATTAASPTKWSHNLLDALKLAACLGAAVTLMWRKRGRLISGGEQKQPVLRERASEYRCQSGTGFSMTGLSSSNTGVGYPNVMAGSLSTPLGMAIATVMAEVLEHEHRKRAPRTADELSKLLEAAMTESLAPVMGSECTGFVEQFKQSFRSTYRLLGSVRNASRSSAPPAAPNYSRGFSQRGRSRGYSRRTDDEEDDCGGLTSSSRGAYLFPVSESDSRLRDPDSEAELADQLSKLTVSSSKGGSKSSTVAKGSPSDGENSSHIDHGEFDDVSSPLRREGLSAKGSGVSGSQVHPNGGRSRWGSGGLEQLANVWGAEGAASQQISRNQGDSSLESDLAMQPFGVIPSGQLVVASESGLSHHEGETHYKQRKIVLMEQEMHLRKMELAYKFRDLNLKEASLHLSSETNSLMKENVDLSRNKADFKEAEFQERKLTAAYAVFAKRCADEMVAGLCVMLCALFFGAWKYSYDRLVDVVSVCQPTLYEPSNSYVPGFNKVINSLNLLTSKLHMFVCEVTVASRMFLGLGIISVVAASLLRKSVTSNSQAMPATILVVVLGGMCGFAGKLAVDSMGGSGYHWLLLWEIFCLVHTAATCFTATLYRVLHGAPGSATGKMHRQPYLMQPWLRLFWFHFTTVLVLPILTGLLPFAHVREIVEVLGSNLWNLTYSPLESYLRKNYQFSLV